MALAFRKKSNDKFANAHVQSEVVHLFDVFLFLVPRYGYLCKGSLENRLKLPIYKYSFAKEEIVPLQKNSSFPKVLTINSGLSLPQ